MMATMFYYATLRGKTNCKESLNRDIKKIGYLRFSVIPYQYEFTDRDGFIIRIINRKKRTMITFPIGTNSEVEGALEKLNKIRGLKLN